MWGTRKFWNEGKKTLRNLAVQLLSNKQRERVSFCGNFKYCKISSPNTAYILWQIPGHVDTLMKSFLSVKLFVQIYSTISAISALVVLSAVQRVILLEGQSHYGKGWNLPITNSDNFKCPSFLAKQPTFKDWTLAVLKFKRRRYFNWMLQHSGGVTTSIFPTSNERLAANARLLHFTSGLKFCD